MLSRRSVQRVFTLSRSLHPAPFSTKIRTDTGKTVPAEKTYRSKHYKPSNDSASTEKKLLEPHVLSARLKKLCDQQQLDSAVSVLKNSPLDAQNVPVWNTLIWESLKAERFKLAVELYNDMKRRGHRPNTRTFQTLLNGFARIENWDSHHKQLNNSSSIFQAFMRHVNSVKQHDPSSTELSVGPIVAYLKILGAAGRHQEIFDVFYSLDSEGPLAPDHILFTAMFQALASLPNSETDSNKLASAKLLWNLMLKASKRNKFPIDGFMVSAAIVALSRGRLADQELAFSLVHEYFGLVPDGNAKPPANKDLIPLEPQSFAAILTLCRNSSNPLAAIQFLAAVLQRPESLGGPSIVDRAHVEQVLQSLLAANVPSASEKGLELIQWMLSQEVRLPSATCAKIRPTYSTYNLLISHICRVENNWRVAAKAFDLMTGYHIHDFIDGVQSKTPRFDERSPGKNISVSPEILSSMMRTAVGSQNHANVRQALRMVHHFGIKSHLKSSNSSAKAAKGSWFYTVKLSQAVGDGMKFLSEENDKPRQEDRAQWRTLKSEAEQVLQAEGRRGKVSVPDDDFISTKQVKRKRERARSDESLIVH